MASHLLPGTFTLEAIRSAFGGARGDPAIRIAVLDTVVDLDHPALRSAHLCEAPLFVGRFEEAPEGGCSHGTQVASILFGQPDSAVAGLASLCSGVVVPIFDAARRTCSQLDLARAIDVAIEKGADIINVSGGELVSAAEPDPFLARAMTRCAELGILIVAAAGNDGCACLHLPAAAGSVLAVGAADPHGLPLPMSNWGDAYRHNGILAPGQDIPVAAPGGRAALRSGTSFAAAIVSGVAALLLCEQLAGGASPDPALIGRALLEGANPPEGLGARGLRGRLSVEGTRRVLQRGKLMSEIVASIPEIDPTESASIIGSAGMSPSCGDDDSCGCGCGCGEKNSGAVARPRLVYTIGSIGFDFVSEARRDSILSDVDESKPIAVALAEHLAAHPEVAEAVTWTLNVDQTAIYALQPTGAFAAQAYGELIAELRRAADPAQNGVADQRLLAIGGTILGSTTLLSGQTVPLVVPSNRAMTSWSKEELTTRIAATSEEETKKPSRTKSASAAAQPSPRQQHRDAVDNFFNRIYYEHRNLGVSPGDRALNFSVTNAWHAVAVVERETRLLFELDSVTTQPSPICRAGSECHDVVLRFYDPDNTNRPLHTYRYTVDVSDVVPVLVGDVRYWSSRA